MRPAKVSDVVGIINKKFPFGLSEEWDNVGLQVGDAASQVERIMVALDPLPEVLDEALDRNCQLLVTHHPLLFKPLRHVTAGTPAGRLLLRAASRGLAVVAMHTNYDIADGGLNDLLAACLGLQDVRPLKVTGRDTLVKLVVFVPESHFEQVRQALFEHVVSVGNYRDCSFAAPGEGSFTPHAGANPSIGTVGQLELVAERRLEVLVSQGHLAQALRTLVTVHPYEEPAFDCYPLLNEGGSWGLGRIGVLAASCRLTDFADCVLERLGCGHVRLVGDPDREVHRVAVCSGSGVSLMQDAVRAGADLLVTGDVKYHEAREAEACGLALLDAGHFATERVMVAEVQQFLQGALAASGYGCEVLAAGGEQDPFRIRYC